MDNHNTFYVSGSTTVPDVSAETSYIIFTYTKDDDKWAVATAASEPTGSWYGGLLQFEVVSLDG